jgi:hypothetical protein
VSVRYLFNTAGHYVAFISGENIFSPDGTWIASLHGGNEAYNLDGTFLGYVLDDDRVAKRTNEAPRARRSRPASPARPALPARPMRRARMPRLPGPWKDVFSEAIIGAPPPVSESFDELDGADLVAADGKFLGRVNRNRFDQNSLTNQFGDYGNQFQPNTIFNQFGPYGSLFSMLSPFNKFTQTPPHFERNGRFIAYLTVNQFVRPRVDPQSFIAWLKR